MVRASILIVAIVAFTGAEAAEPRRVPIGAQASTSEGVRFGLREVCLRALGPGAELNASAFERLVPHKQEIYPGQRSWWIGPAVSISASERACTVRSRKGDGAQLRTVVLDVLRESGAQPVVAADNGPAAVDGQGKLWRQETHCLRMAGAPAYIVISSSPSPGRTPLQATVGRDPRSSCR